MTISRHRFDITTDTGGDFVDTGPPCMGAVLQILSSLGNTDTGCDIRLETVQSGLVIADYDNIGAALRSAAPRILTFDTGGAAVGDQPPVVEGDRLRLTITQSEGVVGAKTATVWVWTGW